MMVPMLYEARWYIYDRATVGLINQNRTNNELRKSRELADRTRIQTLLLKEMTAMYLIPAAATSKTGVTGDFHHKIVYCTLAHEPLLLNGCLGSSSLSGKDVLMQA